MPVSPYDSAGLEAWFSGWPARGCLSRRDQVLFLQIFKGKEPGSLVYKLEPCDQYRDSMKRADGQYRLAGWAAAGDVWRKFIIFAAVRGDGCKSGDFEGNTKRR